MQKLFTFLFCFVCAQTLLAIPRDAVLPKQPSSATAQEIHLNFDYFTTGPKYYKSGDWYIVLENEEDWEVYLNFKAPKDDYTGSFTTKDFLDDYSYIFTPENRENGGIHYEDISMTISILEVNPALQQIVLDATILGDDGNTYIVHATHDVLNAKDEISLSFPNASLSQQDNSFVIAAQDADWNIALSLYGKQVIGAYTSLEHFDMAHTHFIYKADSISPLQLSAQISVAYDANGTLAYNAQCTMLSADTIIYHLQLSVPLGDPVDTIDIVCPNMRIDDTYAEVYNTMTISASNSQYELKIMYNDSILRPAHYSEANAVAYITDLATYDELESLTTQMLLQQDTANGSYSVSAQVRCTNNIVYRLQLSWQVPSPTDTVLLRFDHTAQASYYPQMNNDLLLINQNDRYTLNFNIVGVLPDQAFTLDNVGSYYTSLYDEASFSNIDFAQVDGVLHQSADTTYIYAQIIGFDAVLYDLVLWYAVPNPTDTIQLTFDDVPFDNYLSKGYFQFIAYTPDQSTMISFTPASYQAAGTYINDGLFGQFGSGRYDFFNDYTYIGEWNSITKAYDYYTVEKGQLVVQQAADGSITAQASVICENAKLYSITIHSQFERPHLQYDTQQGAVERIYTSKDKVSILDYTQEEGLIVFEATAADQSDMLVLYFFSDTLDADIPIPAATYPINSSLASGSILASTGVNDDNTVAPSIYTTVKDGYLDKMYFLVDGSVVVGKNLDGQMRLEMNAVNSYDQVVHIIYDPALTALEDIKTTDHSCFKRIIDGQLYIIRDGKTYNASGVLVR
jgi:hypothetical protein